MSNIYSRTKPDMHDQFKRRPFLIRLFSRLLPLRVFQQLLGLCHLIAAQAIARAHISCVDDE